MKGTKYIGEGSVITHVAEFEFEDDGETDLEDQAREALFEAADFGSTESEVNDMFYSEK